MAKSISPDIEFSDQPVSVPVNRCPRGPTTLTIEIIDYLTRKPVTQEILVSLTQNSDPIATKNAKKGRVIFEGLDPTTSAPYEITATDPYSHYYFFPAEGSRITLPSATRAATIQCNIKKFILVAYRIMYVNILYEYYGELKNVPAAIKPNDPQLTVRAAGHAVL